MRMSKKRRTAAVKVRNRRAAETRRLYSFEVERLKDPSLNRIRRIEPLRVFAERVWLSEKPRNCSRIPQIVAGDGYYQSGRYLSYCEGRWRIVLARHERNRLVLLHELIHALGYGTHGVRFRRRYLSVLKRYGGRLNAETRHALEVSIKSLR